MTTLQPVWGLAERLRASMRHAGLTGAQMALYFGVSRGAISEWLNGHAEPKLGTLRAWAERTGVDVAWLCEGDPGALQAYRLALITEQHHDLQVSHLANDCPVCAARDSNPEPADYWPVAA